MDLNIGVIGTGSISEFHIKPYMKHPDVTLHALCDQNEARLQEKGIKYGVEKLYKTHKEMLDDPAIDAVSICTWNDSHASILIDALRAGKHVLVEKPLVVTKEQQAELEQLLAHTDLTAQIGFVRRFGTNVAVLKKFIDGGDLGSIYYAKASVLRRLGNPGGWFSDKRRSFGGPLIDLGVHMLDLCWYLMGRPKPVSVTGNTYKKLGNRSHIEHLDFYKAADYDASLNDVEDLANCLITFENGASMMLDVSFTLHAKEDDISCKIYGDKGGAEIEPELMIVTEKHQTILNIQPQIDHTAFHFESAFDQEVNHFIDCILHGKQTLSPVADGLLISNILKAVYASAESGKEIRLDG